MSEERWEPDPEAGPYLPDMPTAQESYDVQILHSRVQVPDYVFYHNERSWRDDVRHSMFHEIEAFVARRMLYNAEVRWPDGWREAVKEVFYPWLARWEYRLMPMRGAKVAGWLEERWPIRYQRRRMAAYEWLHRRFLERDGSHVAIEVLKPVPVPLEGFAGAP